MRRRHLLLVAGGIVVAGATAAYAASVGLTSKRLTVLSADAPTTTTSSTTPSTTAPNIMTLRLANNTTIAGNTAGQVNRGDTVDVTYSPAIQTTTFCTSWNGQINASNQVRVTIQDGPIVNTVRSNDTLVLEVLSPNSCAGVFSFGSIDLGHSGYVTGGNAVFKGNGSGNVTTITYSESTKNFRVVLGAVESGSGFLQTISTSSVPTPLVATYTPSTNLRDIDGKQPTGVGTTATTNLTVQF